MKKALYVFLCGTLAAWAQTTSLSGIVTDPGGAAIPETAITITHQGTSATRSTLTDPQGGYTFQQLPPGDYIVEAQRPGFSTYKTAEPIRLQTSTPATMNIQMTLGQVSETIEVVGEATAINTENAAVGNPFTEVQVRQLPLQTRNVVALLSLQPGVASTGEVLGARRDQNNVVLDGADVNDNQGENGFNAALPIPLDSVQEFRTSVAGLGANQGRSSGGQVSLITKSGSNSFHGSVYEYHRNTVTSANSWFNNRAGIPRENLIRNQYGFSVGGPFWKDHLFFFYNMEQRKDRSASSVTRNVPSETFRQGIVQFRMSNGQIGQLTPAEIAQVDPLHLGTNSFLTSYFNQYPSGNDPASAADRGLNINVLRFNAPNTLDNLAHVGKIDYNLDRNGMHVLSLRGTLADNQNDQTLAQFPGQSAASRAYDTSRGLSAGYTAVLSPSLVNNFTWGITRISSGQTGTTDPSITLFFTNLQAFPRPNSRIAPTYNLADDMTYTTGRHTLQFGTNMRFVRNDRTSYSNFPTYSFSRNTLKGLGQDISTAVRDLARVKYGDPTINLTETTNVQNAMGAMLGLLNSYSAQYNFNVDGTYNPFGSPIVRGFATNEYEFYLQDVFKIRTDLTLTYGIRYGNYSPVYETNGQQVRPDIDLEQYYADRAGGARQGTPAFALPTADLNYVLGGPLNGGEDWYRRDNNNWAPRLAIAYAPVLDGMLGKLWGNGSVLRAGAGVTYDRYGSNMVISFAGNGSPGLQTTVSQPLNTDFTDTYRYTGVFPPAYAPAPQGGEFPFTPPPAYGGFGSYTGSISNLVAPYQYLLNLSYTRPLPAGLSLEVGYIGRLSHKNLLRSDFSQPLTIFTDQTSGQSWIDATRIMRDHYEAGLTPEAVRANPGLLPLIPFIENVFPGAANDRFTGSATANYFFTTYGTYAESDLDALHDYDRVRRTSGPNAGRCLSAFGCHTFFGRQSAGLQVWTNEGRAAYNGMQLVLRRPMRAGWGFDFNYTWSHALDNASSSETSAGVVQDAYNPNGFRGPSDFDQRHLFTANTVFELPFGRTKSLFSGVHPIIDGFIGGWQISALINVRSGTPISLSNGGVYPTNYLNSALVQLRPGETMPEVGVGFNPSGQPSYFRESPNAAASHFMGQYAGTVGARGILRGQWNRNVDLAIAKAFRMPWEGHRVQVRGEAFNAFNLVNFTDLQTNINNGQFGQFRDTSSPRVMQFALRYEF